MCSIKKVLFLIGLILLVGCSSATPPPTAPPVELTCAYDVYNASPFTCDNTTLGCLYGDATQNSPCYCNGSAWISTFNLSVVC